MKKILIILAILISNIFFTGCAQSTYDVKLIEDDKNKNYIISSVMKNRDIKDLAERNKDAVKKGLKLAAETAIIKKYSNFIIINKDTNQSIGFPINTYKNLYKYCFKSDRKNIKIICSEINEDVFLVEFRILLLNEPTYENISFNAKEVLEEIKSEK